MTEQELQYVQIQKMFQRGTVHILELDHHDFFIQETNSTVYVLYSQDTQKAKRWLIKHENEEKYELMMFNYQAIRDFAYERYHLGEGIICYQAIYEPKQITLPDTSLQIIKAKIKDLEIILHYYDKLSKYELQSIIEQGNLYLGYEGNQLAGFIGEHLEGSMGLLYILEEYRNKGYGYILESYLIQETINKGFIPYCHVECDNEASLALQRKLKLSITKEKLYWLF